MMQHKFPVHRLRVSADFVISFDAYEVLVGDGTKPARKHSRFGNAPFDVVGFTSPASAGRVRASPPLRNHDVNSPSELRLADPLLRQLRD